MSRYAYPVLRAPFGATQTERDANHRFPNLA